MELVLYCRSSSIPLLLTLEENIQQQDMPLKKMSTLVTRKASRQPKLLTSHALIGLKSRLPEKRKHRISHNQNHLDG